MRDPVNETFNLCLSVYYIIHCGVVGNMQASHVCAPGSIPGNGTFYSTYTEEEEEENEEKMKQTTKKRRKERKKEEAAALMCNISQFNRVDFIPSTCDLGLILYTRMT